MRRKEHQSGFSTTLVLLLVLIVTALAATSLVVYQHQKSNSTRSSAATDTTQKTTQPTNTTPTQPQPQAIYANWPIYNNTTYGFSYHYPTNWTTSDETTSDPKTSANSATKQEFGTGLKLTTDTKYNNTVNFEVLNEPLQTATTWYDQFYAQTSIKVTKTTSNLKGKQSVQYDFVAPTYESKQYLFAVGSKTYLFSSINEALNVQNNPNYWSDFNNTFQSLVIN